MKKDKQKEMENNFRCRCQKVPFVKKYLLKQYDNICWFCNEKIEGIECEVFHKSYNHCCKTPDTIKINLPTRRNPKKQRNLPDCESCYFNTHKMFLSCMKFLVPVHNACHYKCMLKYS